MSINLCLNLTEIPKSSNLKPSSVHFTVCWDLYSYFSMGPLEHECLQFFSCKETQRAVKTISIIDISVGIPAEILILHFNPAVVLHVGVVEDDQEEVLSPHCQQETPYILHQCLFLRNVFLTQRMEGGVKDKSSLYLPFNKNWPQVWPWYLHVAVYVLQYNFFLFSHLNMYLKKFTDLKSFLITIGFIFAGL